MHATSTHGGRDSGDILPGELIQPPAKCCLAARLRWTSRKVEYILMLPRESSEPQASESPRRPAQRKIWGVWITKTRFSSQNRVESPGSKIVTYPLSLKFDI
eukprot:scaffold115651_cov91-Phaeocystis_antarctica.AAC.1